MARVEALAREAFAVLHIPAHTTEETWNMSFPTSKEILDRSRIFIGEIFHFLRIDEASCLPESEGGAPCEWLGPPEQKEAHVAQDRQHHPRPHDQLIVPAV